MKTYAVIGNPIKHSLSPLIHNYTIEKLGINARYIKILLPENIDAKYLRNFILDSDIEGINITVPFKELAFSSTNVNDGIANKIQAINTIIKDHNNLRGYNTDIVGLQKCFEKYNLKSALIIGAGGSARSAALALKNSGISMSIANRTPSKLKFFEQFGPTIHIKNNDIDSLYIQKYSVIINATSTSLNNILPMNKKTLEELFQNSSLIFDLVYSKDETIFCNLAKECNINYLDGKDMLIFQAAMSFLYFHKLDTSLLELVIKYMQEALNSFLD